ncbi:MAG TPA: CPBP family intramembrane glutamic endopeptidase [Pirellulales bacterium]|nr:CPBP family intramembrane glutamic endopeptidase [Pirellulales bacterium]
MQTNDPTATPAARAAQFAAMCFALALPTIGTLAYFVLLSGSPITRAVYVVSKVVQFAFPIAWVVLFERRKIAVVRPSLSGLGAGAVLGMLAVAAMFGLYYGYLRTAPVMADAPRAIAHQMSDFGVASLGGFLVLAGFICLVHSLAEEYYWRWFVFGQLRESLPLAAAIAISSLGFMAHHVLVVGKFLSGYGPFTWFFSLCVATGGALWAWLYHRTGTLYGAWLSHFLVDACLMWVGYDLWSRTSAGGF